ncbi:MAG: hypothetical protein LBI78_04890 [Campylobacteraceae bacterium]|nr:hypothetical protein [Campylobacteraceae bacterium]
MVERYDKIQENDYGFSMFNNSDIKYKTDNKLTIVCHMLQTLTAQNQ